MPRARANPCCPKKDTKKDTKRTQNFIALEGFKSGRNRLKHWPVCHIRSIKQRIASDAQGKGKSIQAERTQKGHKKDTNELKYCLVCNICSIHKRIAPNAQGKGKSMLSQKGHKKDTKRTQKGHRLLLPWRVSNQAEID